MRLERTKIEELLDTSHVIAEKLFEGHEYPWKVLGDINGFIESLGASLPENEYKRIRKNIWTHKTVQMAPTTAMGGPIVTGPKIQIHNGAFLEGSVILGQYVVTGNFCGIKDSIIFDEAQAPHFNYIGDSTLGHKVHMGAGAVISSMKADKGLVRAYAEDGNVGTGCKKFGVILGDHAETGYNDVLNPGTVVGCNPNAYPLSSVYGYVSSDSIYKGQDSIAVKGAGKVEAEQEAPEAPEKGEGGLKVVK